MTAPSPRSTSGVRWGLPDALFPIALCLLLAGILGLESVRRALGAAPLAVLGFVLVWVILLGAVLIASFSRGRRSLAADFGFRFRWIDLLWGLGLGLILRALASALERVVYGRSGGFAIADSTSTVAVLIVTVLASAIIAPVIEELFFRGLVLRALQKSFRGRATAVAAVILSSVLFAAVHLVQQVTPAGLIVTGLTTLAVGLAFGTVAVLTGRLGAAIVGHVVFNLAGILATLLLAGGSGVSLN